MRMASGCCLKSRERISGLWLRKSHLCSADGIFIGVPDWSVEKRLYSENIVPVSFSFWILAARGLEGFALMAAMNEGNNVRNRRSLFILVGVRQEEFQKCRKSLVLQSGWARFIFWQKQKSPAVSGRAFFEWEAIIASDSHTRWSFDHQPVRCYKNTHQSPENRHPSCFCNL